MSPELRIFTQGGAFYVKRDLTHSQKLGVALVIAKRVLYDIEVVQNSLIGRLGTNSGFSEEDLPSDIVGFYRTLHHYTRDTIRSLCDAIPPSEAKSIWKRNGGLKKNFSFKPNLYKTCSCKGKSTAWPTALSHMTEHKDGVRPWRGSDNPSVFDK